MAIVLEQYEWICYQDLEWLLENNLYALEDGDDSKGCSSESKCF